MIKKEIVKVSIDEIKVNIMNPRVHNKLNVNMIKKSISKVGYIENIIIDENNVILAGHGRLLALKELGEKEIECLKVSGLSEAQKKQFLVYSNRTTETSDWDGEILFQITDELLKTDKDFLVGDFEIEELVNAYKIEDILQETNRKEISKETKLFVVGITYTKENERIQDVIGNLEILSEEIKDVEIFKGKEITNKRDNL